MSFMLKYFHVKIDPKKGTPPCRSCDGDMGGARTLVAAGNFLPSTVDGGPSSEPVQQTVVRDGGLLHKATSAPRARWWRGLWRRCVGLWLAAVGGEGAPSLAGGFDASMRRGFRQSSEDLGGWSHSVHGSMDSSLLRRVGPWWSVAMAGWCLGP